MEERPIAQGTGTNVVVNVYLDRLELRTGWQNENVTSLGLKQVVGVSVRGFVNSTLVVELNDGRRLNIGRMAPRCPQDQGRNRKPEREGQPLRVAVRERVRRRRTDLTAIPARGAARAEILRALGW